MSKKDFFSKVLKKAKSFFDTRRVYLLLNVLRILPMTGYLQKMFYLRLRMPLTARNFSDKKLGGFATIMEEILMGELNEISFEDAIKKFKRLDSGELNFLLEQFIVINPILALDLYKYFKIDNVRYRYLYYAFYADRKAEEFFNERCREDIDAYLNRYDYFLRNGDADKASKSLEYYFRRSDLEPMASITDEKPLYVDNMRINSSIRMYKAEEKISIIMTVKDEEQLLAYALESIFKQTYQNIELVLVDDGSTDSTVLVFKETCEKYNFFNYTIISMECNVGTFVCKNIALKYVAGEIITFHDADDWSHPQKLHLQVEPILAKRSVASVSNMVRIRPDGTILSKSIYPPHLLCMISLMFRREVFDYLGFFQTGLYGADAEYYERIIAYYGQSDVYIEPRVLTFAAQRNGSLTASSSSDYGISPIRAEHWEQCRKLQMSRFRERSRHFVPFDASPSYHLERGMV